MYQTHISYTARLVSMITYEVFVYEINSEIFSFLYRLDYRIEFEITNSKVNKIISIASRTWINEAIHTALVLIDSERFKPFIP
jgi:hypothetical protein